MRTFINFLWTGFGTGVTAARALGMAILTVLLGVLVAWWVISTIVKLIRRSNAKKAAAQAQQAQAQNIP